MVTYAQLTKPSTKSSPSNLNVGYAPATSFLSFSDHSM